MKKMEMIFIPAEIGMIKVYIYGFQGGSGYGRVFATFEDMVASAKGYNKKRTIVRALSKLYESLANKQ